MKVLSKENLSRIGFVNKTSGFKGKLSCVAEIQKPERLLKKKFLFLILEGLPVPFAIEEIELKGDEFAVKFEDVNDEAAAKRLVRKELYSERLRESKNDANEWTDLVGFTAIDEASGMIGMIDDITEYPMQIIARCMKDGKEILFPLNDDIIVEINDEERTIMVDLPPGLIDVYME